MKFYQMYASFSRKREFVRVEEAEKIPFLQCYLMKFKNFSTFFPNASTILQKMMTKSNTVFNIWQNLYLQLWSKAKLINSLKTDLWTFFIFRLQDQGAASEDEHVHQDAGAWRGARVRGDGTAWGRHRGQEGDRVRGRALHPDSSQSSSLAGYGLFLVPARRRDSFLLVHFPSPIPA